MKLRTKILIFSFFSCLEREVECCEEVLQQLVYSVEGLAVRPEIQMVTEVPMESEDNADVLVRP